MACLWVHKMRGRLFVSETNTNNYLVDYSPNIISRVSLIKWSQLVPLCENGCTTDRTSRICGVQKVMLMRGGGGSVQHPF